MNMIAPQAHGRTLVDANGDVVKGDWRKGLFYASPSITPLFGGTVPGFEAGTGSPGVSERQRRLAYEMEEQANQKLLREALMDLSAMPYGRDMLSKLQDAKTVIVFDRRATEAREAAALADFANNRLPVRPGATRQDMALSLIHEAQHFEDYDKGKGLGHHQNKTFAAARSISLAMEGSARVGEAIVAVQSQTRQPGESEHTYKPKGLMEAYAAKLPHMAAAARKAAPLVSQGKLAEFAAAVFPAFYREEATIALYDKDLIAGFSEKAPRLPKPEYEGQLPSHGRSQDHRQRLQWFMQDATGGSHAEIAKKLRIGGQAYLTMTPADFSLDATANCALSADPGVREKYQAFAVDMSEIAKDSPVKPNTDVPLDAPVSASAGLRQRVAAAIRPLQRLFTRTGSTLPAQKPSRPAATVAAAAPAWFELIHMPRADSPDYMDNPQHLLAGFASKLKQPPFQGVTPIEAVSVALFHARQTTRHQDPDATIRQLADLGLRAPIAAFPADYLRSLQARLQDASEVSNAGKGRGVLSVGERKLVEHWQAMRSHGIDPVYGHAPADKREYRSIPSDVPVYAKLLERTLPPTPGRTSLQPVVMPMNDIMSWAQHDGSASEPKAHVAALSKAGRK